MTLLDALDRLISTAHYVPNALDLQSTVSHLELDIFVDSLVNDPTYLLTYLLTALDKQTSTTHYILNALKLQITMSQLHILICTYFHKMTYSNF